MKKILFSLFLITGSLVAIHAQTTENSKLISEIITGNVGAKLSISDGNEVFFISVKDEDHSCVVDICGIYYSETEETYEENILSLGRNLKEIYNTLGKVEDCAVLKWNNVGVKFTVYGIAPNVAYVCIDDHGHAILSKKDIEKLYKWIDSLEKKIE